MDEKKCVVAYCHIPNSRRKIPVSRANLEQHLINCAGKHDCEISRFYYDAGKDQSGWDALISDCKSGVINLVFCDLFGSFRQNTREKFRSIRELSELEKPVGFCFEEQGISSLNEDGRFFLTTIEAVLEEESRQRSMRIKNRTLKKEETADED